MANSVDTIFEELGKMSVLDLVQLKNKIEEEWGITAAAPVAVAAGPAAGSAALTSRRSLVCVIRLRASSSGSHTTSSASSSCTSVVPSTYDIR